MPRQKVEDTTNIKDEPQGWLAPDDHLKEWSELKSGLSTDSPMFKAWSRALASGFLLGPPISDEVELDEWEGNKSVLRMRFTLAVGYSLNDKNQTTHFYDAHGVVVTESGI